jgi:hypothetical protein
MEFIDTPITVSDTIMNSNADAVLDNTITASVEIMNSETKDDAVPKQIVEENSDVINASVEILNSKKKEDNPGAINASVEIMNSKKKEDTQGANGPVTPVNTELVDLLCQGVVWNEIIRKGVKQEIFSDQTSIMLNEKEIEEINKCKRTTLSDLTSKKSENKPDVSKQPIKIDIDTVKIYEDDDNEVTMSHNIILSGEKRMKGTVFTPK